MFLIPNFDLSEKIGKAVINYGKFFPFFATELFELWVKTV